MKERARKALQLGDFGVQQKAPPKKEQEEKKTARKAVKLSKGSARGDSSYRGASSSRQGSIIRTTYDTQRGSENLTVMETEETVTEVELDIANIGIELVATRHLKSKRVNKNTAKKKE